LNKITPLFKSSFSVTRSILTFEAAGKSKEGGAPSIIDIAVRENLKHVYCVENSLGGYQQAKENLEKVGIGYSVGWIVTVTSDLKSEDASGDHRIVVFSKNDAGWPKFLKFHNLCSTVYNGKRGPQITCDLLKENWDENLLLAIPMYDSYLYNNLLTPRNCVPDFGKINPIYFSESNDLHFEGVINERLDYLEKNEGAEVVRAKSIYYENRDDWEAYLTLRLLNRKTYGSSNTLDKPNLEYMGSREFCVESWKGKL
jgi:DNA polymerase III alpha subunit